MLVKNIKKGLYTDGNKLYTKQCGIVVEFIPKKEESEMFLAQGVSTAKTFDYDVEVKKAKPGTEFFDGDLKVIEKDTAEFLEIKPKNLILRNGNREIVSFDGYETRRAVVEF